MIGIHIDGSQEIVWKKFNIFWLYVGVSYEDIGWHRYLYQIDLIYFCISYIWTWQIENPRDRLLFPPNKSVWWLGIYFQTE